MAINSRSTEIKPSKRMRDAAPEMFEALMHLMHHPAECSRPAWEKARRALEAAGLDFDRDVEARRAERLRRSAARMQDANRA